LKQYGASVMLGDVQTETVREEAQSLAAEFLRRYEQQGEESVETVERLCELATSEDPSASEAGTEAIFRLIVEDLGDRFEARLCDLYIRFFSRVIEYCRRRPGGEHLDRQLNVFGLADDAALRRRTGKLRKLQRFDPSFLQSLRKVLVLSRVTLGADVAVTSVILNKMKQACPGAEIRLVGGTKAGALLASDPRIHLTAVDYRREGNLIERLDAWPALVEVIAAEREGLDESEFLIVDPDSRLTQLGLLPVTPRESGYVFFESRSYGSPGADAVAHLTARWADEVFGKQAGACYPEVSLPKEDRRRGEALRAAAGERRLAAVNLGVGDNPGKRVADPFEYELLLALLDAGYRVVLDRGAGEEELERTGLLTRALEETSRTVRPLANALTELGDITVWEGSLSAFAGLISVADFYVGYDSAGGHLAAALGVPGIDIFAGAACPRMRERWRPWGRRPAEVIAVPAGARPGEIVAQVRERLP
jgi:ADP-heptose:LPS heptosyltransferase